MVPDLLGQHRDFPVDSDPVPVREVLFRHQGPQRRMVALRGGSCSKPHGLHLGHGSMRYQVGPGVLVSGPPQDNLGAAVKEPERAREHCLPSFAGGQHFFEYLLVVSLNRRRPGDDYEPTITYQFPKVRPGGGNLERQDWVCGRQ